MLTFPSDSLPHLVFPMDGDALPPHPFCSAPPHSEPPPPPPSLLPLPSITPRASDGTSGRSRSGRTQEGKPQGARVEEMPSTCNPSSFKRHSNNMVRASKSKQPRFEITFEDDNQKQDGCDINTAVKFQNTEKDFAEEPDEHQLESLALGPACADVSALPPSGWLMGPLFQSFKSKMASFTEIVMSPTKLFKDKNILTPEIEVDKADGSPEANREPRENGVHEEKESSFTWKLPTESDFRHSQTLPSNSTDDLQVPLPSSQGAPLLQDPAEKTADVIEEANVLKTHQEKPNMEKSLALYACSVQLECLHQAFLNVSPHKTNHIDGEPRKTNSGLARSKRTLGTQVQVPSAASDERDLAPAAKCRNAKRKTDGDERDDCSGKSERWNGNVTLRKRKSRVPAPEPASVAPQAPLGVAAQSASRSRPKKAPRGEPRAQSKKIQAQMSTEPLYFEMTPLEENQSECNEPNPHGDQDAGTSRLRNGTLDKKLSRGDPRSRRPRLSRIQAHESNSATAEDIPTSASRSENAGGLLRSYSCPEIPSLFAPLPHQPPLASVPPHVPASSRRARRHTVSSVEVEREIAPLCLRKEVYPSRRSFPCDGQNLPPALSPGSSLSTLASCFLSSPLAFLSGRGESSVAASSHSVSPASSSLSVVKADSSFGALDACSSANLLACGIDGRLPEEDEDTGSFGHEFDEATAALREEKSLSDSELKVAQKHEHHGKVSSIRIRRSLPKPQNNLTPMGLPKAIRLKKKQFSLEEIYTNKNFSKPPESRLETIFEVPLSRRDGSESRFGQRRLKRFLQFLEAGQARKPKKAPAGGGGKTGAAASRTRRGGFARDVAVLLPSPDADTLLCAKLKELDLWLLGEQEDAAC